MNVDARSLGDPEERASAVEQADLDLDPISPQQRRNADDVLLGTAKVKRADEVKDT